jgi:hypothetical protein
MAVAFVLSTAALGQAPKPALTASEVMQRVIAVTGATPPANTVDTLKAGEPLEAVRPLEVSNSVQVQSHLRTAPNVEFQNRR